MDIQTSDKKSSTLFDAVDHNLHLHQPSAVDHHHRGHNLLVIVDCKRCRPRVLVPSTIRAAAAAAARLEPGENGGENAACRWLECFLSLDQT